MITIVTIVTFKFHTPKFSHRQVPIARCCAEILLRAHRRGGAVQRGEPQLVLSVWWVVESLA